MSLVYVGILSHGPGITGRAHLVEDTAVRDEFYRHLEQQRQDLVASGAEALIVVAAEHFANFFMDNMPAYCIGVGEKHVGPIEDPEWLQIARTEIPGAPQLARRLTEQVMRSVDLAYAEEWQCDHGIMVPLHFLTPQFDLPVIPVNINCQGPPLTPLARVWAFGEALRSACDQQPERIAVVGTGGISHWPATPDSGKINEAWDRQFLDRLMRGDKQALLAYTDPDVYRDAGQGGFEIRTLIAAAAVAGAPGELQFYSAELPIFAVGCTVARFALHKHERRTSL
jgi:2,3-dihydroxyphenylpropionate 1,2-dioxygenase